MGAAGARQAALDFGGDAGAIWADDRAEPMIRAVSILILLTGVPALAEISGFPNKPGKKPEPRFVVGAQSGVTAAASSDVVIGAGARSGGAGQGDFGFVAPERRGLKRKPAVGYDPAARLGNKRPI